MPAAILVAQETIRVGTTVVVEGPSPKANLAVVFEDDGTTAYLYALDFNLPDNPISNAVHIYNVEAVADRDIPSIVQLAWSADGLKAVLIINDYPHAIFDFEKRRGYCRTGFPPSDPRWVSENAWTDEALGLFQ